MVKRRSNPYQLIVPGIISYFLALLTLAAICMTFVDIITGIFINDLSLGPLLGILNVVQVLILAMLFLPLRRLYDRLLKRVLYVHNYDSAEFFARLNRTLISTTDLRGLLQRTAGEIASTLQSTQVFFFIYYQDDHHIAAGTSRHSDLVKADAEVIGEWVKDNPGKLLVESDFAKGDHMRRLMQSHRIEIVVPLKRSNQMIGYVCLGPTIHGMRYTNRDRAVITTISDELVIAVQNALNLLAWHLTNFELH